MIKERWLIDERGPRILIEMLLLYGVTEKPGPGSNPLILSWAKAIGLGHVYQSDDIAWCGLAVAFAAARAGWDHSPRGNALYARNWLSWGTPVPFGEEMLGDVLVKARGPSQGHVCLYVGENATHFRVLGCNQADAVSLKWIHKARTGKDAFLGARRCPWRVDQPANVRKIWLTSTGAFDGSES